MKKILFIDDDPNLLTLLSHFFTKSGYQTRTVQDPALVSEEVASFYPHVICLDINMPGKDGITILREIKSEFPTIPVIMVTANATLEPAIESLRAGAFHYIRKPINREELSSTIDQALEVQQLKVEVARLKRANPDEPGLESLIGLSPAFDKLRQQLSRLARVPEAPVLITGETGTGKSFLARILHSITEETARNNFVEVNAGAIPSTLFESELFGYMKGAFTDARRDKIGLIEEAKDGTLFLDEIDSVPLGVQSKLLSFLETRKTRRVGGLKDLSVSTRVVVATNADLVKKCEAGEFRDDLFYRINVINLRMPSLREVSDDIPRIARHILRHAGQRFGKPGLHLTEEAAETLKAYHFPGNVRELRNILERAIIFCADSAITSADLGMDASPVQKRKTGATFSVNKLLSFEELEKEYISYILDHHAKSYQEAARILNISAKNLWEKRKKYNFE